jgi:hypothetical protein
MRAILCGLAVLLGAACVDLSKPRAWRCDVRADCATSWLCGKDHYCHALAVGAALECETKAECTGGWFCGADGRCVDPSKPGPFACNDDTQCAGGWRCSSERRCVDLATEPRALPFPAASDPPIVHSPLVTTGDDLVRTSPLRLSATSEGSSVQCSAAISRGSTLEVASLEAKDNPLGLEWSTRRYSLNLSGPAADLAISHGAVLMVQADAGLVLIREEGAPELRIGAVSWPTQRVVPLSWKDADGGSRGAFVAIGTGREAAFIDLDGGVDSFGAQFATGVIDVAGNVLAPTGGGPAIVVLRERDGGEALFAGPGASGQPLLVLPDPEPIFPAHATRLRLEGDSLAVTLQQGPYESAIVLCVGASCDPMSGITGQCPPTRGTVGSSSIADFAIPSSGTMRLSCSDEGRDFVSDFGAAGETFVAARPARRSWGTSLGHVRQAPGGQLSYSAALDDELTDVLDGRPQVLGINRGAVVAVKGQDLFARNPDARPDGLPLGLSLRQRFASDIKARPVAYLEEGDITLLEAGVGVHEDDDGGTDFPFVLPATASPIDAIARRVAGPADAGVFVVTTGGDLFAGVDDPQRVTVLSQALRPAPGFPIGDWALRAADGGFLEGWAVANNRLFRVTASAPGRWKSTEVAVTGRDALGVWFSGAGTQLGTASGEVLSLPSRVPLVPPLLDGVTSVAGLCGAIFATTADTVWEVIPADAGMGAWQEVDFDVKTPDLWQPRLWRTDHHLFVSDEDGVVLELSVPCP